MGIFNRQMTGAMMLVFAGRLLLLLLQRIGVLVKGVEWWSSPMIIFLVCFLFVGFLLSGMADDFGFLVPRRLQPTWLLGALSLLLLSASSSSSSLSADDDDEGVGVQAV